MTSPVRAACGQFTATSDVNRNLSHCHTLIQQAVSAKCSILFLPEASDYIASSPSESGTLCITSARVFIPGLRQYAAQYNLPIVVGVHTVVASSEPTKLHNTLLYISSDGSLTASYDKLHLFDISLPPPGPTLLESATTAAGDSIRPPLPTPIGNLGLQICFDLRFPEPALALRRLGADVICYPSAFTVPTGEAHWEVLLRARALENQVYVVAAAQVGRHNEKRVSWGQAMAVDPWGRVVGRCRSVKDGAQEEVPEICVVEIDADRLRQTREQLPLNRRWDVYPQV